MKKSFIPKLGGATTKKSRKHAKETVEKTPVQPSVTNEVDFDQKAAYAAIAAGSVKTVAELEMDNIECKKALEEAINLLENCQDTFNSTVSESSEKVTNFYSKFEKLVADKKLEIDKKLLEVEKIEYLIPKLTSFVSLMQQKYQNLSENQNNVNENELRAKIEEEIREKLSKENEEEIEKLNQEKEALNESLKQKEEEISSLSAENSEIKRKIEEIKELKEGNLDSEISDGDNDYASENADLRNKIEELTQEIENLKQNEGSVNSSEFYSLQSKISELEQQNSKQTERIKDLENESFTKNAEILSYHEEIDRINNSESELKNELQEKENYIQSLIEDLRNASTKLSGDDLDKMRSLQLTVDHYKQQFDDIGGEQLIDLKLKNEDILNKNESLAKQNADLVSQVKSLSNYQEKFNEIEKMCEELQVEIEKVNQTNKDLQNENDRASQETEKWKLKAAGKEYDKNLFEQKQKEIDESKAKIEELSEELESLQKEHSDTSKENILLVKRFTDSEERYKELEEKLRNLGNSSRLEIEDLQQQVIDYDQMKEEYERVSKLVIVATGDRNSAERELAESREEVKQLKKQLESNDREKQLMLEIDNLRSQLKDSRTMTETYKTINELISAKADQANQTLADSLTIEPSTPVSKKSSVAVSPFKLQQREPMTPSKAIQNINEHHEQEMTILHQTLDAAHEEIFKLREQSKKEQSSSTYWELQNAKDEKLKLSKQLEEADAKIEEMKNEILRLTRKLEEVSKRAVKASTEELSVRSEVIALQTKLEQIKGLLKLKKIKFDMLDIPETKNDEIEKAASSLIGGFNTTFNRLIDEFTSNIMKRLVQCESDIRTLSLRVSACPSKRVTRSPRKMTYSPKKKVVVPREMLDPHDFS